MPPEEVRRVVEALERVGRDALVPYVECLPMADRIQLCLEATRRLPPSQVWRVKAFRRSCRPEWARRMEAEQ
jgi:hypothetical protein